MSHHFSNLLNEVINQMTAVTLGSVGNVLLTVIISPLLLLGWIAGFLWFLIRGMVAVMIVGFKKGNRQ